MKKLLMTVAAAAGIAAAAHGGLPQPMVVYYGQACDTFGQVYVDDADVYMKCASGTGSVEVARYSINGSLAPGVNFVLRIAYDSGKTDAENYVGYAVNEGDSLELWIRDAYGDRRVQMCDVPIVGEAGSVYKIRLIAGEDQDGDGMPDDWELANGLDPKDPADAQQDMDGDGQSNLNEFLSGTLPWLALDRFAVERSIREEDGRYRVTFYGVYGKVYRVMRAPLALNAEGGFDWEICPFATGADTATDQWIFEGADAFVDLWLDMDDVNGIWRMDIE